MSDKSEVEEALASIQADHAWAHDVLTLEIERLRDGLGKLAAMLRGTNTIVRATLDGQGGESDEE
ncbi:hypothetical protein LCGC14_0208650 [marine sediment metagenome]|uniref:Uncharacterized protein n=1 Tax=marine sediment metagenome TaxID=412755 RepID=A0A0F9UL75_9ZZZZ